VAGSRDRGNRTTWIAAGVAIAALVVITCCLLVTVVYLVRGGAGAEQSVATSTPVEQLQATPTATALPQVQPSATSAAAEPTATEGVPPQPVLNYPSSGEVGEAVTFDGSQSRPGSSPIASYEWDFGDSNQGSGAVVEHTYDAAGTYQVTLTVTGEDGLSSTSSPVQFTVHETATAQPTETPQPTATPEPTSTPISPPVIDSFEVTPDQIAVGECVSLSWSTSGATSWVNVLRNDDFIWENAPLTGSLRDCPDTSGEYRYRIVAYNPEDDRIREDRQVTVTE
jgi:PKD repeat protein